MPIEGWARGCERLRPPGILSTSCHDAVACHIISAQACFVPGPHLFYLPRIPMSQLLVSSDDKHNSSTNTEMVILDNKEGDDEQRGVCHTIPSSPIDSIYTDDDEWQHVQTFNDDSEPTAGSRHVKGIQRSSPSSNDPRHALGDRYVDESVRRTSILRVAPRPSPAMHPTAPRPVSYNDQENRHARSKDLPPYPPANIIVFVESGVGKSSIINMLVGKPVATVSNQAAGCTFASKKFQATIDNREVMLYDTAGLDEAEAGTVSPEQAIQNLRSLVMELTTVNLLVYIIRGTRFRKIVSDNYHMFRTMIHGGDCSVPVVLVITGLENEDNMDDWWEENKAYLAQYKLTFCGHACITATKGRAFRDGSGYIFEDLYNASQKKVVDLLAKHAFNNNVTIAPLPKDTGVFRKILKSLGFLLTEICYAVLD